MPGGGNLPPQPKLSSSYLSGGTELSFAFFTRLGSGGYRSGVVACLGFLFGKAFEGGRFRVVWDLTRAGFETRFGVLTLVGAGAFFGIETRDGLGVRLGLETRLGFNCFLTWPPKPSSPSQ